MPDIDLDDWEILAEPVQPEAAIEFWKDRAKLTWDEAKELAAGARARAFYIAGLSQQDLVQLVSDGIEEALKNGETLEDFKKRIAEVIKKQGWQDYRIENIFRTNMQTAYAAGRYKKMQAVKKSRPYWQYMAVMDKRTRPSHAILHEKVYPADHEFWQENYPPNGFRCRCCVVSLSERQVRDQGLKVETEMPKAGMWTDPKTKAEYDVHFPGADKGFRNNPFEDWAKNGGTGNLPSVSGWNYQQMRALPPAAPDDVEKTVGVTKGGAIAIIDACKQANPDYRVSRNFWINCQRCVPTYELRRRGYPVAALPNDPNVPNKSGIRNGNEGWQNAKIKGWYGNHATILTESDLRKDLQSFPDGARFGIIWVWPGGKSAHTIACEKVGGKLIFLDPQTGQIGKGALGTADSRYGYSYYRMDDKDFTPGFLWDDIARPE